MYEQLTFEDFSFDTSNFVVQSNELSMAKQTLSLNAAKLVRGAIMQIRPEDEEFAPYILKISELAEFLGISKSNLYRDIDKITDEISKNDVQFKVIKGNRERCRKIPWVSYCDYDTYKGVAIKLNPELKPYLLSLQKNYNQYAFEDISNIHSVYSIRIFELIQSHILVKMIPEEGLFIDIPIKTIREALDCEDSYERISNFKEKVLDIAMRDINDYTMFSVSYKCLKEHGRAFDTVRFYVNMVYHPKKELPDYKGGQLK